MVLFYRRANRGRGKFSNFSQIVQEARGTTRLQSQVCPSSKSEPFPQTALILSHFEARFHLFWAILLTSVHRVYYHCHPGLTSTHGNAERERLIITCCGLALPSHSSSAFMLNTHGFVPGTEPKTGALEKVGSRVLAPPAASFFFCCFLFCHAESSKFCVYVARQLRPRHISGA